MMVDSGLLKQKINTTFSSSPLLFGSSGHVGFPMLKTLLFINAKSYAMCGINDELKIYRYFI
ncbi:hypothetical protein [Paraglaciecola sp.]|uniref:hypothetical protein n=1 Tax=Paraglaciecola sp. TaxID=1920173 RepID=UPI0030F41589